LHKIDNSREVIEPILVWDYTDSYQIKKFKNRIFFNLSYWYFEFSCLIPNLTHEVGRYYISVNRNIFNTELLKDEIDSILMNIMVNSSGKKNISKKINISKEK